MKSETLQYSATWQTGGRVVRRHLALDLPLLFEVVVAMVMMLAMRGGLTVVGHCRDEDDDGRKPSKV